MNQNRQPLTFEESARDLSRIVSHIEGRDLTQADLLHWQRELQAGYEAAKVSPLTASNKRLLESWKVMLDTVSAHISGRVLS